MSGGNDRAIGYGLLAGGAVIGALLLVWLMVSGVTAGGFVLGLVLLAVLAGPLAGAGWFMLRRAGGEEAAEAAFVGQRRILESDRLFRRELAAELRQLARRPGLPGQRLDELAEDLERRAYDSPEWYETVRLDDDDTAALKRYDDLVWERARRLAAGDVPDAKEEVQRLEQALDQRRDLLLRGRRAAVLAPSELARAGEPRRGESALQALTVGDAVSTEEGQDYVVENVVSYFAEGRTWKLARLAPSRADSQELWLYVGPGGLEIALLRELAGGSIEDASLTLDDHPLPASQRGTATVEVAGKRGTAEGVLVSYSVYRAGAAVGLAERWPDGASHAYAGRTIRPDDLQVWPRAPR